LLQRLAVVMLFGVLPKTTMAASSSSLIRQDGACPVVSCQYVSLHNWVRDRFFHEPFILLDKQARLLANVGP
jgi:hypothetical protein